jgi:hypothetical protein
MKSAIFNPLAARELGEAVEYSDEAGRGLGDEFLHEVERAIPLRSTNVVTVAVEEGLGVTELLQKQFDVQQAQAEELVRLALPPPARRQAGAARRRAPQGSCRERGVKSQGIWPKRPSWSEPQPTTRATAAALRR